MVSLTNTFLVLCVDPDYRKAGSSQRVRPRKLRPMPSRGHLDDLEDQETLELEVMHVQIGRLTDIRVIDSVKVRESFAGWGCTVEPLCCGHLGDCLV